MNGEFTADNLEYEINPDGTISLDISYLTYLSSNGYTIDSIQELHQVQRSRDKDPHMVAKVVTYDKPKDHPNLDYVADKMELWICDCWAFRNDSADVGADAKPSDCGTCPHIQAVSKTERAEADDSQATLK